MYNLPQMRTSITVIASLLLVSASVPALFAADPFDGTWDLNLQKSKLPSDINTKAEQIVVHAGTDEITIATKTTRKNGEVTTIDPSTTKLDGQKHQGAKSRVTGKSVEGIDKIAKRLDERHIEMDFLRGNDPLQKHVFTVSNDGKTLTIVRGGKTLKGGDAAETDVYDRH
jgi:hypothetical protein